MLINEETSFACTVNRIHVSSPLGDGTFEEAAFLYADYPALRTPVRAITEYVVERFRQELFGDICTRCGNCCRSRPVPVTAGEIRNICLFFHEDDEEAFRHRFIDRAFTWCESDGTLRRIEGQCAFLSKGTTEAYRCEIYPSRPSVCRDLEPSMACCAKETGKLIFHLAMIEIGNDGLEATSSSGRSVKFPWNEDSLLQSQVAELREAAGAFQIPDTSFEVAVNDLDGDLAGLRRLALEGGKVTGEKLGELAGKISSMAAPEKKYERLLVIIREKLARLVELARATPRQARPYEGGLTFTALTLYPERLEARGTLKGQPARALMKYGSHQALQDKVQAFMERLTASTDPALWEALWHADLKCFLCGECCRRFKVEINPHDIDKIAGRLGITEEEARDRYLHPGIFSWNRADALLAKKDGTKLDLIHSLADCIFLEDSRGGAALCAMYGTRPHVCESYTPLDTLCLEMSIITRKDSFLENILSVECGDGLVKMTTKTTRACEVPPYEIHLNEDRMLGTLYDALEEEAARCMRGIGSHSLEHC
ncbi:MAG: YkgJ family cysteine cluster protein [Candidatus Eremiobacteraeota bacterium]|nr:YkgJ family cysteine cluster protein [Candidatus Eremiobacteraeota bacterium]